MRTREKMLSTQQGGRPQEEPTLTLGLDFQPPGLRDWFVLLKPRLWHFAMVALGSYHTCPPSRGLEDLTPGRRHEPIHTFRSSIHTSDWLSACKTSGSSRPQRITSAYKPRRHPQPCRHSTEWTWKMGEGGDLLNSDKAAQTGPGCGKLTHKSRERQS